MKYTLLLPLIIFSLQAAAQNCSPESLVQRPGIWKEGSPGSTGIPAADLAREKKVIAGIHNMIKAMYSPLGVEANFNGSYSRPVPGTPVNGYAYRIIPLNFYCDANLVKTAHETSTYFQIAANMFEAEIYDTAQGDRASAEGFNTLNDLPVEKDGYWQFRETDASLGFGQNGKSSMWLVTYDGKLPYAYVNKKEFLEKRKRSLSIQVNQSAASMKDVLKNIEIEKKYKETEYKNDPAKLQRYLKMDYIPSKERYEKLLADNAIKFKPAFDKIETQLRLPADELNGPAIVKADPADPYSYLFTDDNDPFGKILIKPNPGYFKKNIPRSSPQFFWVYIRGNHLEPIGSNFMSEVMKAVNFSTLKNMLGK